MQPDRAEAAARGHFPGADPAHVFLMPVRCQNRIAGAQVFDRPIAARCTQGGAGGKAGADPHRLQPVRKADAAQGGRERHIIAARVQPGDVGMQQRQRIGEILLHQRSQRDVFHRQQPAAGGGIPGNRQPDHTFKLGAVGVQNDLKPRASKAAPEHHRAVRAKLDGDMAFDAGAAVQNEQRLFLAAVAAQAGLDVERALCQNVAGGAAPRGSFTRPARGGGALRRLSGVFHRDPGHAASP